MDTKELIAHFSQQETLPVDVNDVLAVLRAQGHDDHIEFIGVEFDTDILQGLIKRFRGQDVPYGEPVSYVNIYYHKLHESDWQRFTCCKELLHMLDPDSARTKTAEEIDELAEKIGLPPEMQDPISDGFATNVDRLAEFRAAAILLPMAAREELLKGWLALSGQSPQHYKQRVQTQTGNAIGTASPKGASTVVHADQYVEASDYQKKCSDAKDKRASDLCAQWTAADANQKAAEWAKWQLVASIIGIGGLVVTLAFTLTATRAAPDPITHEWFDTALKGEHRMFAVLYAIRNHGRTPAIIREICGQVYIGDALPGKPAYHGPDIHNWERVLSAGENATCTAFYRGTITPEMLNDLFLARNYDPNRAPTRCYFFGYINYESVHGLKDEVGFIWEFLVINDRFYQREIANYTYRRRGEDQRA